jgi:addiction module HigA family antidote
MLDCSADIGCGCSCAFWWATHPGEMPREEFLVPMNISQRDLASAIHVPYQRVNELVNQTRGVIPSTALRLAKFFSDVSTFLVATAGARSMKACINE